MNLNQHLTIVLLLVFWAAPALAQTTENEPNKTSAHVIEIELMPRGEDDLNQGARERVLEVLHKRFELAGLKFSKMSFEGETLVLRLPGDSPIERVQSSALRSGHLEFRTSDARMDGSRVKRAAPSLDHSRSWQIQFELTPEATQEFAELTTANVGKPLRIFFDDKEISAPVVREPIVKGKGVIAGNFTRTEAEEISNILNAGALPVTLRIRKISTEEF